MPFWLNPTSNMNATYAVLGELSQAAKQTRWPTILKRGVEGDTFINLYADSPWTIADMTAINRKIAKPFEGLVFEDYYLLSPDGDYKLQQAFVRNGNIDSELHAYDSDLVKVDDHWLTFLKERHNYEPPSDVLKPSEFVIHRLAQTLYETAERAMNLKPFLDKFSFHD